MRRRSLLGLILIVGCSDPSESLTTQQKWSRVKSVDVENSTVDDLISKLGAPYRSDDSQKERSRFWYPFEGITSANTAATAPMLIVILDDSGAITAYMRSEPVAMPDAETRIVPREYKIKTNGRWERHDYKTGKAASD